MIVRFIFSNPAFISCPDRDELLIDPLEAAFRIGTQSGDLPFNLLEASVHLLEASVHRFEALIDLLEAEVHSLRELVDAFFGAVYGHRLHG